jgi:hypothetical protein
MAACPGDAAAPRANPRHFSATIIAHPRVARFAMDYDEKKVDEMTLALLFLTMFKEKNYGERAWKSHAWEVLDRLYEKGYISDPKSKAKSVIMTEEGAKRARELFEKHFAPERRTTRQP